MPPIPRSAFRRALTRLSDEAFVGFVADLWAARGFVTRIERGRVIAARPDRGTERRVIAVGEPAGIDQADVDVVVTRRDPSRVGDVEGLGVLTIDDLYERSLYGIDRADTERLFRRYFDRGVEATPGDDAASIAVLVRDGLPVRPAVLALGLVIVLAVGAIVGGFPPAGGAVDAPGTADRAVTPAAPPTSTIFAAQDTVGEARGTHLRTATPVNCLGTHEATLERQLEALASHDPPTNSGIKTVWRFGSQSFRWYAGSFAAFNASMHARPFRHLLGASEVETDLLADEDQLVRWRVTVRDGVDRYVYLFTLEVESVGVDAGCWRTAGLTFRVGSTATP